MSAAELLEIGEACALAHISKRTMQRLVATGEIGHYRLPGNRLRFTAAHVAAWLATREHAPVAAIPAAPRARRPRTTAVVTELRSKPANWRHVAARTGQNVDLSA